MIMKRKCKICQDKTNVIFNINLKATPICEPCATSVFIQQATWYVRTIKNDEKEEEIKA